MKIHLLDPLVAERIAAGEIIERPASVVKEAVENALDAGATEIEVRLKDGGRERIEIIDNGSGMDPDDLALCIQRHATSKIQSFQDLESLSTLGFRGEALASISAIADVTLVSAAKNSNEAYQIVVRDPTQRVHPDRTAKTHFLGSDHGTRLTVDRLFSQVPARLKFLKSNGAEVSAVREWLERLALTRPDVGIRLIHQEQEVFVARPENLEKRVSRVLSDGNTYPLLKTSHQEKDGSFEFDLYWIQGMSVGSARKTVQIVNSRYLKDRVLAAGIAQPFRQHLLPGQFPAVILFLKIDPRLVDVNVHPTKTEVRFQNASPILSALYRATESLILSKGMTPIVAGGSNSSEAAPSYRTNWNHDPRPESIPMTRLFSEPALSEQHLSSDQPMAFESPNFSQQPLFAEPKHPFVSAAYLGILFKTYLCFDLGEEMGLIDQHAAHERIRYEALRKNQSHHSQQLLLPEVLILRPEDQKLFCERAILLEKMGFEVEAFGESQLLFRAIPSGWGDKNLKVRLGNLVERVLHLEGQDLTLDEVLFEKLASEACHSAVRAGDSLSTIEALDLVDQLFQSENPWNCPHGRPTVARVSQDRFDEWFLRKLSF